MAIEYYLLDVFAGKKFQGTQIPVVFCNSAINETLKRSIAGEFRQLETVFHEAGNQEPFTVYSANGKTAFGAHTLLAVAFMASELDIAEKQESYASYNVVVGSKIVNTYIDYGESPVKNIRFSQEIVPTLDRYTPSLEDLSGLINLDVKHLAHSKYRPAVVSIDTPTLIVPVTRPEHIINAQLVVDKWSLFLSGTYANNLLLFAPGTVTGSTDFHGRLMNPTIPLNEYPPIGSVIPEFIAYLCEQDSTAEGTHTFSIDRGLVEQRTSIILLEMDKHASKPIQSRIGGSVIKVGEGKLFLDPSEKAE